MIKKIRCEECNHIVYEIISMEINENAPNLPVIFHEKCFIDMLDKISIKEVHD